MLSYLDQLPKKLSSKKIIGVFSSSRPRDDLFGMYVRLTPHRDAPGMLGLTLISFLQISWLLLVRLAKKCFWS